MSKRGKRLFTAEEALLELFQDSQSENESDCTEDEEFLGEPAVESSSSSSSTSDIGKLFQFNFQFRECYSNSTNSNKYHYIMLIIVYVASLCNSSGLILFVEEDDVPTATVVRGRGHGRGRGCRRGRGRYHAPVRGNCSTTDNQRHGSNDQPATTNAKDRDIHSSDAEWSEKDCAPQQQVFTAPGIKVDAADWKIHVMYFTYF